ncbi:outer membrane protein assembly factor BamB family protein [Cellulomonas sp. CW35]|uniref:outer membrane protein assembly factor BamB family protein n=1 Tax=Cellulomonas sp. CW35 TaxID=3458249 RepID=UPI00403436F1
MVLILGTAPSTSAGAEAPPAPDSYPAVTFQQNARHDGHSQDPAFRGPLSQAWSVQLIGEVAYPLVADGLVFAMSDDKYERGRSVTALSASDGHVVWGPQLVGGVTGGASSFSYDAGRIFVTNDRGGMMALDARTGALQWNVELPFQHVFDPRHATASCTSSAPAAAGSCTRSIRTPAASSG